MKQNYIFDLYGTLVDIHTNEGKAYLWKKMAMFYSYNGAAWTSSELKKAYWTYLKEESRALAQKLKLPEEKVEPEIGRVFERMFTEKGVKASKELVAQTALFFRTLSMEKDRLFPHAKEMLTELKKEGRRVYLLSNAQSLFTVPELMALGIYDCFDDIFISSEQEVKKPSAEFYDRLFAKHKLKKEESVMVGNDYFADVCGAQNYGIDSIYIKTEQSTPYDGPFPDCCRIIQDLSEVPNAWNR